MCQTNRIGSHKKGVTGAMGPTPVNATYAEQVMWRDAETGKLLAASNYFTPIFSGSQMVP